MHSTLLASVLKIYVGGLVVFLPDVPTEGSLRLVFLQGDGNGASQQHLQHVGHHEPYLVAAATDVCFETMGVCSAASIGYSVGGGLGEQIARFQLAHEVRATGPVASGKPIDLSQADLAGVGSKVGGGALCPGQQARAALTKQPLDDEWPIAAYVDLVGVNRVTYDDDRLQTITIGTGSCQRTITVADRIIVDVDMTQDPTFTWKRGDIEEKAVLKRTTKRISLWNLPQEASGGEAQHGANHLAAYFSLLNDKDACRCFLPEGSKSPFRNPRSTEPVFCPPSQEKP